MDNFYLYKTQDGHLAKTKSGVSGDRIANDQTSNVPVKRWRIGSSASAGNYSAMLCNLMMNAGDNRVSQSFNANNDTD
ncbi:MAG: hypothetical protein IPN99_14180 [Bacteroidetes bacterium]|nr:hypothetical protein [Bacteroidota bacterium]